MTIATDHDLDVQSFVSDELEWTPDVDAAGIGVSVEDGSVTLSGEVQNSAQRLAATRAALRVRGVRAVVDNLTVHPKAEWPVTETDIGKDVVRESSSSFYRSITLPEQAEAVGAVAEFAGGVLTVTVPLKRVDPSRNIPVGTGLAD